jgi:NADH dehydrogenase
MSERLVVVGGGFAGFWAALAARRVAGAQAGVALVSREPMLQMRPRLYEADPQALQIDLRPFLNRVGVEFVEGEASALDCESHYLVLHGGRNLRYSRLVVATGSTMRRPPISGAADASSIDTVRDAIAFDRRLADIVRGGGDSTVIVVGAGFTGIELALELRDRIRGHGGDAAAERARVVLVDRAQAVGSQLGTGPRPVIERALADARIEVVLGATIDAMTSTTLVLGSERVISGDAVVLTTGMQAAEFARRVPGEHDHLGRVVVDQFLQVPAAAGVFVAGDAAAADGGDGHTVLQSCQHALQIGRYAGENAARDLLVLPKVRYVQPPYITCLDLGRSGAVYTRGWDRKVHLTGGDAKAVKWRINREVIYPPRDGSREELLALSNLEVALQRLPGRDAA